MKRKKPRVVRFDLAMADICAAVSKMERLTGGHFKFYLEWEPPAQDRKGKPDKDPRHNGGA